MAQPMIGLFRLCLAICFLKASFGFSPTARTLKSPLFSPITPLSSTAEIPDAPVPFDFMAGNNGGKTRLPPGRPTPKFFGFLFDDTVKLLNPSTMGSYQLKRKKQFKSSIFKTNIFFQPTVFLCSSSLLYDMAQVENSCKAFFPPHHKSLFGHNSLLVQSGQPHKRLRQLLQPSLTGKAALESYSTIIEDEMTKFFSRIKLKGGVLEVVPLLRKFFVDVAIRVLLGSSSSDKVDVEALSEDLTVWSGGLVAAPLTFIPWSKAAKAMRARKRIVTVLEGLIEDERKQLQKMGEAEVLDSKSLPLLSRLVSSEGLSNDDIIDNVLTFVFAGSDTTASAATSIWLVLSENKVVREALRQYPNLADRFCKNILQAYPPAPFSMRLVADGPVQIGAYTIPKGWQIANGFKGVLGDEAEIDVTNLASDGTTMTQSLAFGYGPRMCPGRYVAAIELESLTKQLVQWDWELEPKQKLKQSYTPGFFPKDGLKIKWKIRAAGI